MWVVLVIIVLLIEHFYLLWLLSCHVIVSWGISVAHLLLHEIIDAFASFSLSTFDTLDDLSCSKMHTFIGSVLRGLFHPLSGLIHTIDNIFSEARLKLILIILHLLLRLVCLLLSMFVVHLVNISIYFFSSAYHKIWHILLDLIIIILAIIITVLSIRIEIVSSGILWLILWGCIADAIIQ